MDFLQPLQHFTKGDIQQGKWMIGIAILLLFPIAIILFKTNLNLQKGMAIAVGLLSIISVAYGGYVVYSKPKNLTKIENEFHSNPEKIITIELEKAKADHKSYTTLKYIWGFCAITLIVLYFLLTKDFHKGLSLGFAILFLTFLLIDTFFHQRLNTYSKLMSKISN